MRGGRCELWGYPGAGKSTIAQALKRKFGVCIPALHEPSTRFDDRLKRRMFHLRSKALWAAYLPPDSPLKKSKRSLAMMAYRQAVTLARCKMPCVLEEGIVHEIWRILYRHPDQIEKSWWKRAIAGAAPTVIVLDLSPELAMQRVRSKSKPGRINVELRDDASGEKWTKAVQAYNALSRALLEQESVRVFTIDSSKSDVDNICREIVSMLNAMEHP